MAELDQGGFSAVDAFFGPDGSDKSDGAAAATAARTTTLSSTGNKRLGVGAASTETTQSSTAATSRTLEKRVLQVGRKRGRQEVTDEEEDETGNQDFDEEDDNDDVGGRTSIATAAKGSNLIQTKDLQTEPKMKKKKKGKKEREKEKGIATTVKTNALSNSDEIPPKQEPISGKPKRKRPKVRSRQKNIRKDNREKKPDHLVIGSANYQGLPLTKETRRRLNLGPSKEALKVASMAQSLEASADQNDGSEKTGISNPNTPALITNTNSQEKGTVVKNGKENVLQDAEDESPKKAKRRRRRKSKFKNLMV